MFNPIKKYIEMIDRDVDKTMREDLLKKGLNQDDVDLLMNMAHGDEKKVKNRKLTPEERLNLRMKNSRF